MPVRSDRRSFIATLAALTIPTAIAGATPRAARVAVSIPTGAMTPYVRDALRDALHDELGRNVAIEVVDETRAAFVLSASMREEHATGGTGCVVSVLVEERGSRRLRAILEGSARTPSSGDDVETSALVRVAVRSALRSLGRAIG